ncbi:MAG TPA: ATPase, T2SS/T4P/T4SS family [Woeseiaceae bacterium]
MARKRVRLGELLLEKQLISEEQLNQALEAQRNSGRKLGRVLIDIGAIEEGELHRCLSDYLGIPYVDLAHLTLEPRAVQLLPEAQARRYRALVLKDDARGPLVGMADPTDLFAIDELTRLLGRQVRLALVKEDALLRTIDLVYRHTGEIVSLAEELDSELGGEVDLGALSAEEGSPDAPVIKLIQSMFQDAVQVHASDIHIEPDDRCLRVRIRVDGLLQEQVIEGRRVAQALVTRLKLMCGLDIAEKRLPQDGRFSIRVGDKSLDVRVSTMPIYDGEGIVLRLLDHSAALLDFDALGMPGEMITRFNELIERSAGLVLVTGPTGSGKTTTLYAALSRVNAASKKIITAEDPIEYRLARVNQVQINARIGLDFATVLRNALRQDPDIVLVGEMRDRETVEMGLRAAMTGHLVFSTLHTINAIATVNRLLDMGARGYLIASALQGVLAQRLVRRVCDSCAQPAEPTVQQRSWLSRHLSAESVRKAAFKEGEGCTYCNMTGFRGRIGVYELLEIDVPMAEAIRREDLGRFARCAARRPGFVTLTRAALGYAAAGVTSVAEVMRVTAGIEETGAEGPVDPPADDDFAATGTFRLL